MPQMAPMNWLNLFFMMIMILMIFNSMNYFNFIYKPKKTMLEKKSIKNNWKW